jgi:prepilin-type N-terminal cleavage/methylation domain-containing protein
MTMHETAYLFRASRRARLGGFTLAELLTVLAIMAVLTVLAVPSLLQTSSSAVTQDLLRLNGLLEEARQYALANNTYVWVAFAPGTDSLGVKTLTVAVLASTDGTDPASPQTWAGYSYGTVPSQQIALVNKVVTLRHLQLSAAATFTSSQVPGLPAPPSPVTAAANSPASNSGGFFQMQLPTGGGPVLFTTALQFTPQGEARNRVNPIDLVDLDLQAQMGNSGQLNSANVAVIRVDGLTGEPTVYRP